MVFGYFSTSTIFDTTFLKRFIFLKNTKSIIFFVFSLFLFPSISSWAHSEACHDAIARKGDVFFRFVRAESEGPVHPEAFSFEIKTLRTRISPLKSHDIEAMKTILNEPGLDEHMLEPNGPEFIRESIDGMTGKIRRGPHSVIFSSAIYLKATETPIGAFWVYLYPYNGNRVAGVSFVMNKKFLRRGGREVLRAMIDHLKDSAFNFDYVFAIADSKNKDYIEILHREEFEMGSTVFDGGHFHYYIRQFQK